MKEDIYHIASSYFKGNIKDSERVLLNNWLNESEQNRLLFRELENIWKLTGTVVQNVDVDVEAEWQRFSDVKDKLPMQDDSKKARKLFPSYILRIAAVVIPLFVLVSVLLLKKSNEPDWIKVETANNMRTVELPDGSKVWINKNSSLLYPTKFIAETRLVKFTGEAFFDVAKSKKPFKIETEKVSVIVLGTKFNLRSFRDETFSELFLKEGKVLFSKAGSPSINVTLNKGEIALLNDTSDIIDKFKTEASNAAAWRDKKLVFQNAPLTDIAKNLERYFDIQVILPSHMEDCRFSGEFSNPELYSLLDIVSLTVGCTYKLENNILVLSGGSCN